MDTNDLRGQAIRWLLDLATDDGINASGKEEIYGCIFGRDSAISILKILSAHSKTPALELLEICHRGLQTLINLQGKEFNLESGEEPGKFIHEFRKEKYEHLVKDPNNWFLYPDGYLRNYDSIDSTGLTLIAIYRYFQITHDQEFLLQALPAVEMGLNWIITFGDKDKDFLVEYELAKTRKHGGLVVQSWTDSYESLRQVDGSMPLYPIAPVEAQAISWLALKLWAEFYATQSPKFAKKLSKQADSMKQAFNNRFIIKDEGLFFAAQALDGYKRRIKTITANPLICLWATFHNGDKRECILDDQYVEDFVKRGFMEDLFDLEGGIRTMSTKSPTFNNTPQSYHNGSFWPMLNGLIYEGLQYWNFWVTAETLRQASLVPIYHFGAPVELYIKSQDGSLIEYQAPSGQVGCRFQAWSAAAALDFLSSK